MRGDLRYLLDPHDGVIKLRVYGLQVFERGFLVQHSLVERQREAGVDELSMVQSLQGGFVTLETTIRNVTRSSLLKFRKIYVKTQCQFTEPDDTAGLSPLDLTK